VPYVLYGAAADTGQAEELIDMPDLGGMSWVTITVIGVALLAVVIAIAALRNRSSKEIVDKSEQATRDLYKEEDRIHRDDGNGSV
jgi:hypothetical protein